MSRFFRHFLFFICAALLVGACDPYPKDPHKTYANIRNEGVIKVGVVDHPPFAVKHDTNMPPTGIEVRLIQGFADNLSVSPQWHVLPGRLAFDLLSEGKLDMVIGGFDKNDPWSKKSSFTRPYFISRVGYAARPDDQIALEKEETVHHVMAVRKGENRLLTVLEEYLKNNYATVENIFNAEAVK